MQCIKKEYDFSKAKRGRFYHPQVQLNLPEDSEQNIKNNGAYIMDITLPLDQMSTGEKLSIMESLWDDICKQPEEFSSPAWHKDILEQRQVTIDKGNAEFIDWEQAKNNIRQAVRQETK